MGVSHFILKAVSYLPGGRVVALLAAVAVIPLWPGAAAAQGRSDFSDDSGAPLWLAVNAGAGASVPLPLSSPMKVGPAALTWNAGVAAHFTNMSALALRLSGKEFAGKESLYDHVKYFSITARGYLPVLKSPHFDIMLVGEAGVSNVQKSYIDPMLDEFGEVEHDCSGIPLTCVPKGKQVSTDLLAPTGGLGVKFVLFPADFIGLYVESVAAFTWFTDFNVDEGAVTLDTTGGAEIHF